MKILHVSLANPWHHSGGLNAYCVELINWQLKQGIEASVIFPGPFLFSTHPFIHKVNDKAFEILDALPIPINYGIDNPRRYMVPVHNNCYMNFLRKELPDIIHVHSFQGIHVEFFETAALLKIPIVLTTHDHFGLCFKSTFYRPQQGLCCDNSAKNCRECNFFGGLSVNKQRLVQSQFYSNIKNNKIIKNIKDKILSFNHSKIALVTGRNVLERECVEANFVAEEEFTKLQEYYNELLSKISMAFCNSQTTQSVFNLFYPKLPTLVQGIRIGGISGRALTKKSIEAKDEIKIGYFGGGRCEKGFSFLISLINKLNQIQNRLKFFLYGDYSMIKKEYLPKNSFLAGCFSRKDINSVYSNLDLVIVPSISRETFSFVVLEALSYGKPVLCSDTVGAKDLVNEKLIFCHSDIDDALSKILWATKPNNYNDLVEEISHSNIDFSFERHAKLIKRSYLELIHQYHV